jgi:hypothetical protein
MAGNSNLTGSDLVRNELVEDTAQYLLGQWIATDGQLTDFPPPISSWKPSRNIPAGFSGVTGITSGFTPAGGQMHTHPTLAKRLALAEQLATTSGSRRPGAR